MSFDAQHDALPADAVPCDCCQRPASVAPAISELRSTGPRPLSRMLIARPETLALCAECSMIVLLTIRKRTLLITGALPPKLS